MFDLQPCRIANKRRDLMTERERLLDKLPSRPARSSDDQDPQRIPRFARRHNRIDNTNAYGIRTRRKILNIAPTFLSCRPHFWEF
jgi:hypothetical protein